MSIPFRERNPVPIGAIGLLSIALVLFLAFNVQSIPFIGGGNHYRAAFSEAGGLIKGDDVRIAVVALAAAAVLADSVTADANAVTVGSQTTVDLGVVPAGAVIDLEVTANRPDCLSVVGLARANEQRARRHGTPEDEQARATDGDDYARTAPVDDWQ